LKHKPAAIATFLVLGGIAAIAAIYLCKRAWVGSPSVNHWAFVAPQQKAPPGVEDPWVRNVIDVFVIARLQHENIRPAQEAERSVLIRRLSLDLTGLPPIAHEVERFVHDTHPQAYEHLVDRLLGSPHFGEKWAQHWLDLARYADSDGYEQDWFRKYAYNYRDWVIEAINSDLPLDQFTIHQIAGDLLLNATRSQKLATAFHCQTPLNREPGSDAEEFRRKEVVDRVNTTASAFLGLTVACAECHSHPHDSISQKEYYQLYAFFNNTDVVDVSFHTDDELAEIRSRWVAWREKSNYLTKSVRDAATTSAEARRQLALHLDNIPSLPRANKLTILTEREDTRRETHIHVRGDFLRKGNRVKPGTLRALHPLKARNDPPDRLDLARWITAPENPLTARVLVNQIWGHLFERGLVSSIDDFGTHGAKPSHPELLDWLAVELRKRGWSRKEMIRLIVTSATYRQSSNVRPELAVTDPENVLLARQDRFRLTAEEIRDAQLAVSGLLQHRIGGASFRPPVPTDVAAVAFGFDGPKQKWDPDPPADQHGRSLYIVRHRTLLEPMLAIFDAPDSLVSCARRERSNSPQQALVGLNHPLFHECSCALGKQMANACGSATEKIRTGFKHCLAREPTADELTRLHDFYQRQMELLREDGTRAAAIVGDSCAPIRDMCEAGALTLVARVLLNLEEFIVRE
jgi:hypothetical protein